MKTNTVKTFHSLSSNHKDNQLSFSAHFTEHKPPPNSQWTRNPLPPLTCIIGHHKFAHRFGKDSRNDWFSIFTAFSDSTCSSAFRGQTVSVRTNVCGAFSKEWNSISTWNLQHYHRCWESWASRQTRFIWVANSCPTFFTPTNIKHYKTFDTHRHTHRVIST